MITNCRQLIVATLFLKLLAPGPVMADFATATSAYDGGDYATAFREWRALAEAGDTASQIALAGLYRGGIGGDIDLARAAYWYGQAAKSGDAVAQLNLAEMYEHGWGVARNKVAAYVWYQRAAVQGRNWAADRRDRLAGHMTASERALAKKELARPRSP